MTASRISTVTVLGAGAWGTALASCLARAGRTVRLWGREQALMDDINASRINTRYLPGVTLPQSIHITHDPAHALKDTDAVVLVIPAQHLRGALAHLAPHMPAGVPLVNCAKGIEVSSGKRLSEVIAELAPGHPVAVLSGPNFAREVALGLPAAATIAGKDAAVVNALAQTLGCAHFRPYTSSDVAGVETCGALKNVMAIAAGITAGAKLGENARAALVTRGLGEIARIGAALGAKPETFYGLAGMGDLILTATSPQSRNYALGYALGEGRKLKDILHGQKSVTEGVATAAAVLDLAHTHDIDVPICTAIHDILYMDTPIKDALADLMARPITAE